MFPKCYFQVIDHISQVSVAYFFNFVHTFYFLLTVPVRTENI
jgi:hypothetical protein